MVRLHGSLEDLYETRATLIPVTAGAFKAQQKNLRGPK